MKEDYLNLEKQLCFPLYACSKELIKKYKPFLDPLGLTYTQYIVLLVLWQHQRVKVKCLGEHLYLDSGTLTPLLKKLESDGIVFRERCIEDERNVHVSLTQKGEDLKIQAKDIPTKMLNCLNITQEEYLILHEMLNKMLLKISK